MPHFGRIADADGGRHETFAGIETHAGRQCLVSWRQQRRSFRRSLQRLRDHNRDRLVRITHLVVLQQIEPEHEGVGLRVRVLRERRLVGRGHDIDDAGVALGSLHVKKGHATARDARDRQNSMEHSGRVVIRCVTGFSLDLQDPVAAGQRLPDIRAVSEMGRGLGEADLRLHRSLRDRCGKRTRRGRPEGRACAPAFLPRRASGRARGFAARARS